MASLQVAMFFEDADGYGWSERFWYGGDTSPANIVTNVTDMANARAAMLTTSSSITRVRVASSIKRNPQIITFGGSNSIPGTYPIPTAPSEVALLVSLQNPAVGYNRAFLRGLPREVVQADSYVPTEPFLTVFNAWALIMVGGNWNIVGTLGGSDTQYPISLLMPSAPRGYTFTCAAPPTMPPLAIGSIIRVHNTKIPGFSGLKTIVNIIGSNSFKVGGASPPVEDTGTAPYFTVPGAFDSPLSTVSPGKLTRRGAGRPFGLIRGRRQTLYSLRQ